MAEATWRFREKRYEFEDPPLLMGIVNVTPDSFSDGGLFLDSTSAVEHALGLVEEGADLIDVGGESTRPGAEPVSIDEELSRVIPVIEQLATKTNVPISIDTSKADVVRQSVEAGATIVNDVSGLRFDPQMANVCRETEVGVICMHMQGTPQDMQDEPHYENVVAEVCDFFSERLQTLEAQGIPRERIVLDPGIGFGKTARHNIEILSQIDRFQMLSRPILIGHSRKRFLEKVIGRPVEERMYGTLGVSIALAAQGTSILRVHDVRATRDAVAAWTAISSRRQDTG